MYIVSSSMLAGPRCHANTVQNSAELAILNGIGFHGASGPRTALVTLFILIQLIVVCGSGVSQDADAGRQDADAGRQDAEWLPLFLRYDAGGTDNIVRAIQFSPDGNTLYAAGWNKVIQVYQFDEQLKQFRYLPRQNFRVPISHGRFGMLESMAVSADGRWLAAAGAVWEGAPAGTAAYLWPRSQASDDILQEIGAIYVFDTQTRECRVLRGHRGAVRQLAFAEGDRRNDTLISVGFEYSGQQISQSVRSWSVVAGQALGAPLSLPRVVIPPSTDISPRIRGWVSETLGLQVAVAAWRINSGVPVSELQIWSPQRGGTPRRIGSAPVTFAMELTGQGQQRRLFCGGMGEMSSFGLADPARITRQAVAGGTAAETPFAAVALPRSTPGSAAQLAVVTIERLSNADKEYRLNLVEGTRSRRLGRLWVNRGTAEYGSAMIIEPAVCASQDGRFLAVAGSQQNEVRLYNAAALRSMRQASDELRPVQVLGSRLVIPYAAAFVQSEDRRGIAIATEPHAAALKQLRNGANVAETSVILDATGRRLLSSVSGWTVSNTLSQLWTARLADDRLHVEATEAGTGRRRSLRLPSSFRAAQIQDEVTAFAICDPQGENPPLAAIATHIQGEPQLYIFDADTGDVLRMLRGHDRRIMDVRFSNSGDLLLTASLDGTVRGWLMKDLHTTTKGRVGWLSGLHVTSADGRLIVDEVEAERPAAAAGIRRDDQIEGIVTAGKVFRPKSAAEFYLHISQTAPQQQPELTLRLRRGQRSRDVVLPLDQGADVREPLFSLLLSSEALRQREQNGQGWLVWSPPGQFDVEGAQLQQQLGWHINTGEDAEPVVYASVDQYRDRFLHAGLLGSLLMDGRTVRRPPVEPEIRLSLVTENGDISFPDYDDQLVLRQPGGHLVLEFEDQTGELVHSAEWSVADQPAQQFLPVERDLWKSAANVSDLGRGEHLLHVRLLTTDEPPVEYTQAVFLRVQPAAPGLKLLSPDAAVATVEQEHLQLRVHAHLSVPATVSVIHEFGDGERAELNVPMAETGILDQQLTLKPGRNGIRIVARNDGIPDSVADYSSAEQESLETSVDFIPPGPPIIRVTSITDPASGRRQEISDGVLMTDAAELMLHGTITAERPLSAAGIVIADQRSTMAEFQPGTAATVEFSERVVLQPGRQSVIVHATASDASAEISVDILYRPPLPALTLLNPLVARQRLPAPEGPYQLKLTAQLQSTADRSLFASVTVNGIQQSPDLLSVNLDTGIVSGEILLMPDDTRPRDLHRIELLLQNDWGGSSAHPLAVEFQHPPQLLNAEIHRRDGTATAEIVCDVRTSGSRPIVSLRLSVNGDSVPAVRHEREDSPAGIVRLAVREVPLREGPNEIRISATNADGPSAELVISETVTAPPQPADIALVRPLSDLNTLQPLHPVVFRVRSRSELQRVDLIVERDHRRPQRISLLHNPETPSADADLTFEHQLELTSGVNRVQIEVLNAGGAAVREFSISYLPPPVTIRLTHLSAADGAWNVPVVEPAGNRIVFDRPADDGLAVLNGRINWLPGHRPQGDNWTVRVWVNGFLRSLRITPPEDDRRELDFEIPVVLNQPENRLRIESPEISFSNQKLALVDHHITAMQNIAVRCIRPEMRQRLHLVIMGVQMQNGRNVAQPQELQQFAASALRLEAPATAFAEVRDYAPLVGEKAVGRNLRTLMVLVESEVAQRRATGRLNDVVMFYYRGREHQTESGEFVLEDFQNFESPAQHPQSITESYLAHLFEHLPGAHVVFLDVENADDGTETVSRWPQFPNLGLFRIAWSGQQPVPLPPGPLLSTVQNAAEIIDADGTIKLGMLQDAFHTQLGGSESAGRFRVDTFVPEDLLNLIVARLTTGSTPLRPGN